MKDTKKVGILPVGGNSNNGSICGVRCRNLNNWASNSNWNQRGG